MDPHPTSSSVPRSRLPWALLLGLAMVAGFEGWVRAWPLEQRVAYRADEDQAIAVRNAIEASPGSEVAFVGSSMTYQGIVVPVLEARLAASVGRPVEVANYAIRGGRIDLSAAAVKTLLRKRTKPRLIVVGIAMRDLREHGLELDRLSQLWTVADFRRERRGRLLADYLPQVIRNQVSRSWWTLRYRTGIALAAQQMLIEAPAEPMPALGQLASQHEGSRAIQSIADDAAAFFDQHNKARMIQAYRPELRAKPPTILSDRVNTIISDCVRAGVKVVFVEMPISQPLRHLIDTAQRKTRTRDASRTFEPEYRKVVERWTTKHGVPLVRIEHLGVALTDADFYDGQHLNYAGALKMTEAIVPIIQSQLSPTSSQPTP